MEENKNTVIETSPSFYEEETRDLLGIPPSWLTRWGNALMFVIICILMLALQNFDYPESLSADLVICKNNLVPISAKTDGRISAFIASDRSFVKKNQSVLKFIDSIDTVIYKADTNGYIIYTQLSDQIKKGSIIAYIINTQDHMTGVMVCNQDKINKIKLNQNVIISSNKNNNKRSNGFVSKIVLHENNRSASVFITFDHDGNINDAFADKFKATIITNKVKLIDRILR